MIFSTLLMLEELRLCLNKDELAFSSGQLRRPPHKVIELPNAELVGLC